MLKIEEMSSFSELLKKVKMNIKLNSPNFNFNGLEKISRGLNLKKIVLMTLIR